jgi:hypothetical protein
MAHIQVKDGKSYLFWKDKWTNNILEQQFPQLNSFARDKALSVHSALNLNSSNDMFNLPPSHVAYKQLLSLNQILEETNLYRL